jgi:hypothetical protein
MFVFGSSAPLPTNTSFGIHSYSFSADFPSLPSVVAFLYEGIRYHFAAVNWADDYQQGASHHHQAQRSCRLVPLVICNARSAS